ncbi:MAG: hypothetical protein JNL71_04710 [Rhodospirillales bacterium]|nr:hypothetical protein [Rhodospirillales bacterium]
MENVLAAVTIYFALPFALGGLLAGLRALVDGLAWLIHGPPPKPPDPEPVKAETIVPIPLARLGAFSP